MPPYRVLVVDDSVFMRKLISDLISENPLYHVIATAKNGLEAVEKAKLHKPDMITMDVEMPEMDGLQALKIIMREIPTPVIMLSNLTKSGANETLQALEWGAIDFLKKPSGSISLDMHKIKFLLYEKLDIAVQSKVKNCAAVSAKIVEQKAARIKNTSATGFNKIVAIGTSTGGPKALHRIISQIPESFPAPIVIVQHMPPNFTKSLAQRLDAVSNIRVVEGEEGLPLEANTAYIAPGGSHMIIVKEGPRYCLHISKEERRGGHRPSVDMLFESLVPFTELKKYVVIMTGMGSDGAKGMLALKNAGAATTIAEAEETCVVYGMPRAAIELNCVDYIVQQQQIADKLVFEVMK